MFTLVKCTKLPFSVSGEFDNLPGNLLLFFLDKAEKSRKVGTYMQTDLDSGEQVDLAQQIPVQSPVSPTSLHSPDTSIDRPIISHQRQEVGHCVGQQWGSSFSPLVEPVLLACT